MDTEDSHSTRKRSRNKKKKIEEIEKPRGLARGLQPEKILAAQLHHDVLFMLVKWQDCLEVDVVLGHDLGVAFPEFMIDYYEKCGPFSVKNTVWKTPRIAPELSLEDTNKSIADASMDETGGDSQDSIANTESAKEAAAEKAPSMDTSNTQVEIPVN